MISWTRANPAHLREVLDHAVVEVFAAQVRVARRGLDLARRSTARQPADQSSILSMLWHKDRAMAVPLP